ncbi:MAG: ferredoxin [Candidatus Shikimatogenerans bostrichidophilus]|nr:MAG: ferredoxin [Candidatus Shikimatogenerans bostrichidophilus]
MLTIIYKRKKCIGCNSCVLVCPLFFSMSKIDGKSVLLKSIKKKENYILKGIDNVFFNNLIKAKKICPVKIINIVKY